MSEASGIDLPSPSVDPSIANGNTIADTGTFRIGERATMGSLNRLSDDTDTYNPNILKEKSDNIKANLEKKEHPEDTNTLELFNALPPVKGVRIDGQSFFLSQTASADGRYHCVGYVQMENGQIAPRLFYKSNSDGDWRVAPYYERTVDEQGREQGYYSKGDTMEYGYVRETRVVDDLRTVLEDGAQKDRGAINNGQLRWLTDHFSKESLGVTNTYEDEVVEDIMGWGAKDSGVYDFVPGKGFQTKVGQTVAEVISKIEIPDMIKPDFSMPVIGIRISEHPFLGQVTTEQIVGSNSTLVWNFSRDKEGRVWVSGIVNGRKKKPNSYGADDEVYSAGLLDNKPIEYKSQVAGLIEGVDYNPTGNGGYVDITPLLDNLRVIQDYRQARGVPRLAA